MAEENPTINLVVDGEARQYKLDTLSDAARQKIAQLQFAGNNVLPLISEVARLVQLGQKVDQGELTSLLPKEYVVLEQENAVESEPKIIKGDDSSKQSK
jgi:hypothetical protein